MGDYRYLSTEMFEMLTTFKDDGSYKWNLEKDWRQKLKALEFRFDGKSF